ncbi:MAG: phage portal protein [Bacteroidaceae bacterium]|nr:phage portal protein [Bacteroidaceae bacterium]
MRGKTLEQIFEEGRPADHIIADLKRKTIILPSWSEKLVKEYEPSKHPVMDKAQYPDRTEDGVVHKVSRIAFNTQKLVVKRMAGLCYGIPVNINFMPDDNDTKQKEVATYLRTIFERTRINSVNIERAKQLFASCEVFTLWYGVKQPTKEYGFDSDIKLRCRTFSPMNGDELYPLFDAYGDLTAFSISYTETTTLGTVEYFDTYTADKHYRWVNEGSGFVEDDVEEISTGKIPGVYVWRPEALWEDTSPLVYEREWKLSRNGNYLDKNNKPIVTVCCDEKVEFGKEEDEETRSIVQLPANGKMEYVTWQQAVDNLKFHDSTLKSSIFEQLQIPNWSYEDMKAVQTSGEGLKQLFIDAHLKVKEESGRLIEMHDREVNVVKSFLKVMLDGKGYDEAIDALKFYVEITPYIINDEKEHISNLMLANGNKPIMSHRESVALGGYSPDVDKTMREIAEDNINDVFAQ